jgi:hypothetical protein
MSKYKPLFTRGTALALTAAMAVAAIVPALAIGKANAGQLSARKITMSDSTPGATGVTYSVTVTPALAGANDVLGFVLSTCDNSPIDGDSCTSTPGTDTPNFSSAVLTGWTKDTFNTSPTNNNVVFTRVAGQWTGGTPVTLDITGVVNPSNVNATGTFYARAYSYALAATAKAFVYATPGAYIDFGGFALSAANQLNIQAKVQERLTFCVYVTLVAENCAAGFNSIKLGDANGVLDPQHAYVNNQAKFDISTNAISGASVVMKGTTLTSGSNTITAMSDTANTSTPGSKEFGMCMYQSTGSGLSISAPYADAVNCILSDAPTQGVDGDNGATFAFNDGVGAGGTNNASGDTIATKAAGDSSTAVLNFIGNIAWSTEAGIYQTNLTFIATGTY